MADSDLAAPRALRVRAFLLAAMVLLGLSFGDRPSSAAGDRAYSVAVTMDPRDGSIAGTVEATFENTAAVPIDDVAWLLYANRFAAEEPDINDLNRPFVYPREEPVPGEIRIEAVEIGASTGRVATSARFEALAESELVAVDGWPRTMLRARLPRPLPPGAAATVRARFRVALPARFGPFGIADGRITALGGWFPTLPALTRDGTWDATLLPPLAEVHGELSAPTATTVAVGGEVFEAPHASTVSFALAGTAWPSLLASDDYVVHRRTVEGVDVVFLELPPKYFHRFPPGRSHAITMLDAIERVLRERPAELPPVPSPLVVAEAPLRLELTGPSRPGVAIVSDRMMRVHELVRVFHERELATAVYAAILRAPVARREPPADAPWIGEGVAAALADRYVAGAHPRERTVGDWIAALNLFAIVDRFESAPKIPFADVFFPQRRHASELRDGIESFARDRPSGRTILTKLRNEIGDDEYDQVIQRYLAGNEPLRETASRVHGESLDWLFAQWVAPYPTLDYAIGDAVELNRPADSAGLVVAPATHTPEGGDVPLPRVDDRTAAYEHVVPIVRRASRPIREAVDIELVGPGGHHERYRWPGRRDSAELRLTTPWPVRRVTLDPDHVLLEDTRRNDEQPPSLQMVLDSADVTVTSSEFAISGLFVARRRYDYTKDIGLIGFLSDRSIGFNVGPRVHFGTPIDPTLYRHNLYGYYTLATLRGGFHDRSRPERRDDGTLGGVGFRYDYTDEFAFDNPTDTTKIRLFGDWFTGGLGSTFDYLDWGARLSLVRPLLSDRTLGAVEILNAFSSPVGSDRVPNQGRYSLGGDLAIRGIRVDERLGENIALVRAELRQTIYPETDFNLMDWLVIRRGQLRLFVDSGRVEDRRASLYRLSDFAVGVGVGVAMFYDFMGFYPAVAYVALAERVDRFNGVDNGVQFLFGTRQAF